MLYELVAWIFHDLGLVADLHVVLQLLTLENHSCFQVFNVLFLLGILLGTALLKDRWVDSRMFISLTRLIHLLKDIIDAGNQLDCNQDLTANVRVVENAYEQVVRKNTVHLPVIINDKVFSELVLDLHLEFLCTMDELTSVNYLIYDTLWAVILANEGKIVDDFLFVGLLGLL